VDNAKLSHHRRSIPSELGSAADGGAAGTLASFAYGYDIDPATGQPTLLGQRTSFAMTIPSQGLSSATASYAYDYQGRRTGKSVSGSTTTYLYDGLNLVQAAGALTTVDYLFGPGIDEPLASVQGGVPSYDSVDGLGSVYLLTDTSGAVQDAYLYDAWGEIRSQTGSIVNDFGYTAREFGEAGLGYYRARYYQPGIGRFASEDPQRSSAGAYLYVYVGNDPSNYFDPSGQEKCVHSIYYHYIGGSAAFFGHHFENEEETAHPTHPENFNLISFRGHCDTGTPKFRRLIIPAYATDDMSVQFPNGKALESVGSTVTWGVSVSSWWVFWHSKQTFGRLADDLLLCYDCCSKSGS